MAGTVRQQVGRQTNGSHSGATPTVRNAEGLVQVQVADVGAQITRLGQANHGVHVGTIEVHLPAGRVHLVTDFSDGCFKNAVRGGVRDHQRGQVITMLGNLGFEVSHVQVAAFITLQGDHGHTRHHGGGRVGAVG